MAAVLPASATKVADARQLKGHPTAMPARGREPRLDLKPGELVRIKSATEIMATLDRDFKFEGIPFMLEMLPYCGGEFRVRARADSTCSRGDPRRLEATVYLDQLRCSGLAHGRCQAACLLLWKEAWLTRVTNHDEATASAPAHAADRAPTDLRAFRLLRGWSKNSGDHPRCQATELWAATCPIELGSPAVWLRNVVRDLCLGRLSRANLRVLGCYARGKLILFAFTQWAKAPWNRDRYRKTPSEKLDLQPGEWVEVRGIGEILRTLDRKGCNRGLEFKSEMFQFCGRRFQVKGRLERRIDERSGQLCELRNECIVLDSVYCHGQRSFCSRCNYHYWREIWLRRVSAQSRTSDHAA